MNLTNEGMLRLSNAMPEEIMLTMIGKALADHNAKRTDETRKTLAVFCVMFSTKVSMSGKDLNDEIRRMNEIVSIKERLNSGN